MTSASSATPGDVRSVERALTDAESAISAARTMLAQGNIVDLKGLEDHIEQACNAIPALPKPDRDRLKPTLVSLIDALNTLTDMMAKQHDDITKALQGIGSRRQAVSAYKPGRKR